MVHRGAQIDVGLMIEQVADGNRRECLRQRSYAVDGCRAQNRVSASVAFPIVIPKDNFSVVQNPDGHAGNT
jgi:hypothetical protein